MGFFDFFRWRPERKSLANPSQSLLELFGVLPTMAGVSVSPSNAMRCTAVKRAISAIAEPIGNLPLHVYRREGEGKERDYEHHVSKLLRDPNPWTSASEFREQLQRDCLLHGNGYAEIVRVEGKPKELIRLPPEAIQVTTDDYGAPVYRQTTGNIREIPRENVFHLKAASLDGVKGESPVMQAREAIAFALLLERHGSLLFSNGATPGGVIEIPDDIGEESLGKIRAAWQASQGGENQGKVGVLIGGAKFNAQTFTNTDSQFLELRRYAVDEIARAFGVPPHLLFELGRGTWGNTSEMGAQFVTFVLTKWTRAWQSECRLKLFSEDERDTFYVEFVLEDLLKADLTARATAYSQLISARVMNPNEARGRENLPPYAGGEQFANPHIDKIGDRPGDGNT